MIPISIGKGLRPAKLKLTVVILSVFNCMGFFFYDPSQSSLAAFLILYGILAVISFAVIWYYWHGQNWARWLVMIGAAFTFLNLATLSSFKTTGAAVAIAEAVFGAWLLYWLNTKPVVLYFRSMPRRPPFRKVMLYSLGAIGLIAVLLLGIVFLSAFIAPTLRPVYEGEIPESFRKELSSMYPKDERLLGLFSTGTFQVTEGGCLFTDRRIVVFDGGEVIQQAMFKEIRNLSLYRNTGFLGMSELAVDKISGIRFFCPLPNATAYPYEAGKFHSLLEKAWQKVRKP